MEISTKTCDCQHYPYHRHEYLACGRKRGVSVKSIEPQREETNQQKRQNNWFIVPRDTEILRSLSRLLKLFIVVLTRRRRCLGIRFGDADMLRLLGLMLHTAMRIRWDAGPKVA